MKPIVEVIGLWKEYQRGAQKEKYLSLRDSVINALKPSAKKETFWALEDINFTVNPGDSLAIVGKNGAGKSTLLKILSKITPPSKGEIILRGRLASLLEVGTGFHPELTGRENVYLNGSILGLGRQEINRQFDAIVEFSGVEAFLETPLKHYSSGMQLRLAFAVAAHLEPEILVIDEVLAVGDSTFQQKCIEKMTEVSQSGRTLLFVSHNMQAVRNLCQRGIMIADGKLKLDAGIEEVLNLYASRGEAENISSPELDCTMLPRKSSKRDLEFSTVTVDSWNIHPNDPMIFRILLKENKSEVFKDLLFGINILDRTGQCLYHLSNIFGNHQIPVHQNDQYYVFTLDELRLKPGNYSVGFFLRANEEIQDWIIDAATLNVLDGNTYGFSNSSMIQGVVQPKFSFHAEPV